LRFRDENVLEISSSFSYPSGSPVLAGEGRFADTAQLAFSRPSGVTFTRVDSGSRVLDRDADSTNLMKLRITTEESITIKTLSFRLEALTGAGEDKDPGGIIQGNNIENLEPNLKDFVIESNGETVLGPVDLAMTSDEKQNLNFSGNLNIPSGQSIELWVRAKVVDDCPLGQRYKLYLRVNNSAINGGDGLPVSEVNPSGELASGELEVSEGALQVNLGTAVTIQDIVGDPEMIGIVSFDFVTSGNDSVNVSKISLTGYVDENEGDSDFAKGQDFDDGDATGFSDIVERIYLYEGGSLVAGPLSVDSSGFYTFNNLNWKLPGGESKTLTVKADISSRAPFENGYDRISLDINEVSSDITATSNGQSIKVSGSRPNQGANPAIYVSFRNSGNLKFTNVSGTPEKQIVVAGDDVLIAAYEIRSYHEDIEITRISFKNPTPEADDCIDSVKLSYNTSDGASGSKEGNVFGSVVDYNDLGMTIPEGGKANISLVLESRSIEDGCDSGDRPSFNLDLNEEFYAKGLSSGLVIDEDLANNEDYIDNDTEVNDYVVMRRAEPIIGFNVNNPSGDAVRGINEVMRFDVEARGDSDIEIKKMVFKITSSDSGNYGDDNDLLEYLADVDGDFFDDDGIIDLYKINDPGNLLAEDGSGHIRYSIYDYNGGGKDETPQGLQTGGKDYGLIEIEFPYTFELVIPKGEKETFVLELETAGIDSGEQDIKVDLLGDDNETIANFEWNDGEQDISGYLVDYLPLLGRYLYYH
jgi:hypothetical protein